VVSKLWKRQQALEAAGSFGGGQRLWRRSEALWEVEGSEGSIAEALETAGSCGNSRKLWREVWEVLEEVDGSEAASMKPWRQQEALEAVEGSLEEARGSGGDQRLRR
jgi:hypothetical protein